MPVAPDVVAAFERMDYPRVEKFPEAGELPWLDRADALQAIDAKLPAGELNAHEASRLRDWVRDGYLIIEGAIEHQTLDEGWAAYERAVADGRVTLHSEPIAADDPWPGRFLDPHLKVSELCGIMRHPAVLHWARLILGREPEPFQTIASHKGSQQREHSDSIHMTTYPIGYLVAAWVAFEDIHPDSGPLVYYPGSHRFEYLFSKDLAIPEDEFRARGYSAYVEKYEPRIQALLAERKAVPHHFYAKKGDVLIWHANLLHGGSVRRDVRHSRRALVSHYFAEGVICYHDFSASKPKPFHGTCLVEAHARS